MKTKTDKATARPWTQCSDQIYHLPSNVEIAEMQKDEDGPDEIADIPTRLANAALIVTAVNLYEAHCAVAEAAGELRDEQTSLDMAGERKSEKERLEARLFYIRTVSEAQNKLDDALENLAALAKTKGDS